MQIDNTRDNPRDNPPPRQAPRTVSRRLVLAFEVFAWAALLGFATLFLGLRYWLLPNVEEYREQIVAAVSRSIDLPIKVDAIRADWLGFRPQLDFENVRVYDTQGREALVLPHVHTVVSWRSLLFRDLRLHAVEIGDLKLTVRRDRAGVITVGGIRLSEDKGDGRLTDWVLGQREIAVSNAEIDWIDEFRGAPPLALSDLNFRLRNTGDEHAIGLSARPPAALGSSFEVRAELIGRSVTQPSAWNGRVFAEVGNTDLAAWRAWLDYPIDVRAGLGALRVWATFGEGKVTHATADVVLSKVVARLGKDLPVLELSSVSGRVQGRDSASTYELAGRNLRLVPEQGPELPATSFQLSLRRGEGERIERGSLGASAIELAPLARLAGYLPFPSEVRDLLSEIAPRGALLDVKFDWQGQLPAAEKFTARGRFDALGMNAWGRIPGFANLSGSVDASETKGTLHLAAHAAELDLPKVFPEPRLKLDALNGEFGWERSAPAADAQRITVRLANLGFANADAAGTAFGSYAFDGTGPGTIDLSAHLSRTDGREVERYLPVVVGGGVRKWLRSAIVAGQSSDVRLRLNGDLRDFPFVDPAKGQFQIIAKVDKGVLDYVEGWPRIEAIEADLIFEREKLEVVGHSASILGARLSGVRVSIPDLRSPETVLRVNGIAEGPTAEFLQYIQASPVRRMVKGFTDAMSATGRGRLRLQLDLPLAGLDKSRVDGEYQFSGNNMILDARLPPIERAAGRVDFSENTINVREVRGSMLGGLTTISGGTRADGEVVFDARGDATVPGLRAVFDHPWRRQLSGGAPYTATVTLRGRETRIVFETGLGGVASELPPPLAKSAGETAPLRVEIVPLEGGDRISVAFGGNVLAEFARSGSGESAVVQRAAVVLGTAAPTAPAAPTAAPAAPTAPLKLPETNGMLLTGSLPALNLDRWLPLLSGGGGGGGGGGGLSGAGAGPSIFDLSLGSLDVFGKRLNRVVLRGTADASGWVASLAAQEMTGQLTYRGEGRGRLSGRFADFSIPAEYPGAPKGDAAKDLPAVDLIAESFTFRGKKVGRVEIGAQHEGGNWRIDKLINVTPDSTLTGKGVWRTGGESRTSVEVEVAVSDLGRFLERYGHPGMVKGGTAKVQGRLAWAADPVAIDYPSLSGELSLEAENGQVLEVEQGLGKLLSLFKLDLTDAFGTGFAFSRVTGSGKVERGVLRTQDVRVRGSSADIFMQGESDLAHETQSLRLRVVPSLSDGVSSVAGFFAGPVVGLVSLLAQRLLKNPLGQIFAYEYTVIGTWSDPKVERVGGAQFDAPRPAEESAPPPAPAPAAQAK